MKDLKQMDFFPSTSSQEDTLANLSPLQVEKKVKKIQDTSGQSILDLSKNSDQLGLLEKMLVDTLNLVSTPYSRTWRVKVTPQGRLVFQLRASVQTTKEKESGLWPTPAAHEGRLGYQRRDTGKKGTQKSLTTIVIDEEGGREKTTGQLNPTWVEWLMGYPIGWTDLNVSETALSHKSPTTSDQ
jgi:hypothetical protein